MSSQILFVEDEPAIRELVRVNLAQAGYEVTLAGDVVQARQQLTDHPPDLILLDWMLPGISGLQFARELRAQPALASLPIILLTARVIEGDKLSGFEAGVDDYVTKPFSMRELLARIQALLRRSQPSARNEAIEIDGLRYDPVGHRVTANGTPVALSPIEMQLLGLFMRNADRVLTRSAILDHVWGHVVDIDERTIDVHIRRLRLALQPSGYDRLVETVRGIGYRLQSARPAQS